MNGLLFISGTLMATLLADIIALIIVKKFATRLFRAFFYPVTAGGQSEAARLVDIISGQFLSKLFVKAQTALAGVQSGTVRQEKAVESALMQEMASQTSPLLGMALKIPAIQKLVRRNPDLIGLGITMMGKKGGGPEPAGVTPSPAGNGQGDVFKI